jgi:spermidine/putrescine transport system substrate-binding protein
MIRQALINAILIGILITAMGCGANRSTLPIPTPPPLAKELVLYDWAGYMPQSVLDAFTEEYGVEVSYLVYETQEEAIKKMRAGEV